MAKSEQDKKENARIAAAEIFREAQIARENGNTARAESLEAHGRSTARFGR